MQNRFFDISHKQKTNHNSNCGASSRYYLIKHNFQLELGGAQSVQWLGNGALDDQNLILSRVKRLLSLALCLNHLWGLPDLLFDGYCMLCQEAVVGIGMTIRNECRTGKEAQVF